MRFMEVMKTVIGIAASIALSACGCGRQLDIGSNVIWSANHESGTFDEWMSDDAGASYAIGDGSTFAIVTDLARSGTHSVRVSSPATSADAAAGLYRHWNSLSEAYFSVWYYVPRVVKTTSYWTIMQFSPSLPSAPPAGTSMNLNLRGLPNGQMALEIVQQRQAYLRTPLAIPTPIVPIAQWFQIEAKFRSATDETGLLKVWLDGNLVYDVEGRVTALGDDVYFTLCSATSVATPTPTEIYFDDVIVSRSRITPDGTPALND
jgi:hypothetical protein